MKINIKTTGITITPSISEYVDKRFQTLEKFFENDSTVRFDLELAKTTNHHKNGDIFKAEVHIVAKNKNIYTVAETDDLYSAIDNVRDETLRDVKNSNAKIRSLIRKGGAKIKSILRFGK